MPRLVPMLGGKERKKGSPARALQLMDEEGKLEIGPAACDSSAR